MILSKEQIIQKTREEYDCEGQTDEEIWYDLLGGDKPLFYLYGDFDEDDIWYHILNVMFKEKYKCWFIDEAALKKNINEIKVATDKIDNILLILAKRVHKGLKDGKIYVLEAIDMEEDCFLGQQVY